MKSLTWLNKKVPDQENDSDTVVQPTTSEVILDRDYLTDLPNRRSFEQQMSAMIGQTSKRHSGLAVMTLSLNKFAFINDTLGHSIGDKIIQNVSRQIGKHVPGECLIARTGGDEFTILVPNLKSTDFASTLANKVLNTFEDYLHIDGYTVYVTASIGMSFFPTDGSDVGTLIRNADIAVRRAKEHGYNKLQAYTPTLDENKYKQFSLFNDFKRALHNDEFVLYYQPRLDTLTEKIVAAEALVRWQHHEWGLVLPGEFIHIAENNGLIVPLGEWVLRAACRQLQQWETKFPNLKVSVNVSIKQLLMSDFVDSVKSILNEFEVEPQRIEFEVTETSAVHDYTVMVETIKELRNMGISIYFDDFGIGYSSLSWLYQFDLDGIKLDRSFISHIPHDRKPTQIIESVIRLARRLNLTVIAEGVETEQQLPLLKTEQCHQVQGFLYSRPLPVEQFEDLLRSKAYNKNSKPYINKRKYFRIELPNPLNSKVTISSIQGKKISIGYSDIMLLDIGPGGIRFNSDLQFPNKHGVVLNFSLPILDTNIELDGSIVWIKQLSESTYQYGAEFSIDELTRDKLALLLNQLAVKLKAGRFTE